MLERAVTSTQENNPASHEDTGCWPLGQTPTGHLFRSTTAELLDGGLCRRQEFVKPQKRQMIKDPFSAGTRKPQ